jgi:hypothetical protein
MMPSTRPPIPPSKNLIPGTARAVDTRPSPI